MPSNTTNLELRKIDPSTDGNLYVNVDTDFNDNWQKIDDGFGDHETRISTVEDELDDHEQDKTQHTNGWRTYNTLTEIGLTEGTETMESICVAMQDKSELRLMKFTSNTSTAYPATTGILTVRKYSNFRIELKFSHGSSSNSANEWVGYYDANISPNFTGWKRVVDQDFGDERYLLETDYEEGIWTPTLTFGGLSTGISYVDRYARYTKMGNMLFWEVDIILSSKGTATGNAAITGLPFSSSGSRPHANISGSFSSLTLPTNVTGITYYTPTNNSNLYLRQIGNNIGLTAAFDDTHFTDSTVLRASGKYTI